MAHDGRPDQFRPPQLLVLAGVANDCLGTHQARQDGQDDVGLDHGHGTDVGAGRRPIEHPGDGTGGGERRAGKAILLVHVERRQRGGDSRKEADQRQ